MGGDGSRWVWRCLMGEVLLVVVNHGLEFGDLLGDRRSKKE